MMLILYSDIIQAAASEINARGGKKGSTPRNAASCIMMLDRCPPLKYGKRGFGRTNTIANRIIANRKEKSWISS